MSGCNGGYQAPSAPIRIPRTVICDQCGKPFETVTTEPTCTQCMIRPSRRPIDFSTIPKEISMPVSKTPRATKPCVECKKEFVPTGNCQKRCEECRKIKSHHPAVRVKTRKPKDALPPIDPRDTLGHLYGKMSEDPSTWQAAAKAKALAFAIEHGHGVKPVEHSFAAFIQGLHAAGVTGLAFGNVKITIEAV